MRNKLIFIKRRLIFVLAYLSPVINLYTNELITSNLLNGIVKLSGSGQQFEMRKLVQKRRSGFHAFRLAAHWINFRIVWKIARRLKQMENSLRLSHCIKWLSRGWNGLSCVYFAVLHVWVRLCTAGLVVPFFSLPFRLALHSLCDVRSVSTSCYNQTNVYTSPTKTNSKPKRTSHTPKECQIIYFKSS